MPATLDDYDTDTEDVYDEEFEILVRKMLERIGEKPDRGGLKCTPLRVAMAMDFLTSGYSMTVQGVVRNAVFEESCEEMVIVRDIELLLPV